MTIPPLDLILLLGSLQGFILATLLWVNQRGNLLSNRLLAVMISLLAVMSLAVGIPITSRWVSLALDLLPMFMVMPTDSSGRTPKRYAPKSNRFKGQVYVLMNGESASTASEFLAVAHANNVGVFIGTESGGAYEGGNGGSFINLELPKSGIQVTTPLVYYNNAVPKPKQEGRGTLPDYDIPITQNDFLTHTDSQFNFVVTLIRKQLR